MARNKSEKDPVVRAMHDHLEAIEVVLALSRGSSKQQISAAYADTSTCYWAIPLEARRLLWGSSGHPEMAQRIRAKYGERRHAA